MKLSCLPVSLYEALSNGEMSLADWFEFASELGLDGADVSVAHLAQNAPDYLHSLRNQSAEAGVEIAMLVSYTDFTHPDAAERSRQVDLLRTQIDAAHELGAQFVRTTAGQAHPGVSRADGVSWAVEGLTACLDHANDAGVILAYENHTKGYGWDYNDFSQPADIFLEILDRTTGTDLGILYDTANTLAHGDDPFIVLEAVEDRISVVHLNDIAVAGEFEPVQLGTGVVPIQELLSVLVADGFDGWVSVEEFSKQGKDGFPPAIAAADTAWIAAGGKPRV